jgi:hypothetical protein
MSHFEKTNIMTHPVAPSMLFPKRGGKAVCGLQDELFPIQHLYVPNTYKPENY